MSITAVCHENVTKWKRFPHYWPSVAQRTKNAKLSYSVCLPKTVDRRVDLSVIYMPLRLCDVNLMARGKNVQTDVLVQERRNSLLTHCGYVFVPSTHRNDVVECHLVWGSRGVASGVHCGTQMLMYYHRTERPSNLHDTGTAVMYWRSVTHTLSEFPHYSVVQFSLTPYSLKDILHTLKIWFSIVISAAKIIFVFRETILRWLPKILTHLADDIFKCIF